FTVSLFITGLAFDSEALQADAKIGTLLASVVAAAVGTIVLTLTAARTAHNDEGSSDSSSTLS
ncbi:MAG: Na+/H+ antiporter NhaA, partial [Ilumatobacteraceae bacterium]